MTHQNVQYLRKFLDCQVQMRVFLQIFFSLLSKTQSKENCCNSFRRLQKALMYPHNPMKKTLKSQVCVKAPCLCMSSVYLITKIIVPKEALFDCTSNQAWLPFQVNSNFCFEVKYIQQNASYPGSSPENGYITCPWCTLCGFKRGFDN